MTLATKAFLEKAYLAYFGRPVDPTGLTDYKNSTETQVADAFAASAESKALYGSTFNYAQINAIYLALFNRDAEKAGLEYWYAKVADKTFTPAGAAIAILNGALNADKIAIENKLAASAAFTAALDTGPEMIGYSGDAAAASARSFISGVTATAATAAAVDAAVVAVVAAKNAVPAQTFTLTTGADNLTGTAGNDTFLSDSTSSEKTSVADTLDGGSGTDTLVIYSDGSIAAMPALTSIETVSIYGENTDLDLSVSRLASLTTANFERGDGDIGITVGANVATVNVADMALNDAGANNGVTINFAAADTTAVVGLNKITVGTSTADEDVNLVGAALATVTINATGTASSFEDLFVAAASSITINADVALTSTELVTTSTTGTLTITGAGAVGLGTLDDGINTITATSATGALTAAIGAAVDTVVNLGSGADVITASTTNTIATTDTLAVNAGTGTDILVIADSSDIDTTADGARYVGFETVRFGGFTQSMAVFGASTITALQVTAASTLATNMTAAQAASVTLRADAGGSTFALAAASGTSDVLTITAAHSTTATASADMGTATITGFETLNFAANTGDALTTTTADRTTVAFSAASNLKTINLTGTKSVNVSISSNATAVTNLNAADIVGGAILATGGQVGALTVTGSAVADSITIGTAGTLGTVSVNGGSGNDSFTTTAVILANDGVEDTTIVGGLGTDKLTVSDATTLTDNHFTNLTGFESLVVLGGANDISVTSLAAGAKAAFADGMTVTLSATQANAQSLAWSSGLYDKNVTLTWVSDHTGEDAAKDINIATGSGADKITVTASSWIGDGASADLIIATGAGVDTIVVTTGTLANAAIVTPTITAGTGADSITVTHTNGTNAAASIAFIMASGESNATTTGFDTITGALTGNNTNMSDKIDFAGDGVVGTLGTSTDFNTILSHTLTTGLASFSTAATYATATVINSSNLTDVVGYLAANTATLDAIAFLYDSNGDGSNDGTMIYSNQAIDSLVFLSGTTVVTLVATNATTTGALFID
jgi:hypothetical protein